MIIHSVVPIDIILAGHEQIVAPDEIEYAGIIMHVERLSGGQAKIVRLISADPAHYLLPDLQPGSIITL